ncbi:MAG: TlpA disulfide reductase family protein [Pseudomonadota bacterium]
MIKKIIISLSVIAAIAFGFLYGNGLLTVHHGLEPPASLAVLKLEKEPKSAPSVGFDAGGRRYALEEFRGRYVLLNLWATWCAPCVAELPALVRLQARAPGLRVVAVNTDRKGVDAAAFLQANRARALVPYRDTDVTMLKSFKAYGLPLTVLIDPEGKIIARAEGPAEWDSPEAVKYFKRVTGS